MYRIKTAFTDTRLQNNPRRRQELFCHFFYQLIHFLCFYQGCDSTKKAKNQQLKTLGSTVDSTISIASLFHDT